MFNRDSSNQLTKYPVASLRELIILSLPLVLSTLSASLLLLGDRYFLSNYSLESFQACTTAAFLCFFYQMTLIMIATAAQAFIGHFLGSKNEHLIGPLTWQMIYFSIFSLIITYPCSLATQLYLKGTEIQDPATLYFHHLSIANFLFPLGATLSSFYIGRGKTRVILIVNICAQLVNIGLDYLLIFGVDGWFLPMGIKGAALATIAAQSFLCFTLFLMFLQKKYVTIYRTDLKRFNIPLLWDVLKIGIPRAIGRSMIVGGWVVASYFLVDRGGDYLLVLTFGVSLFLFFCFITEGMAQALITIVSHILGAKIENIFNKLINTSLLFLGITMLILAVPLLFMKTTLINFFIHEALSPYSRKLLEDCCFCVWVTCFASGINRIGTSLLTAARDTIFYAGCTSINTLSLCFSVFLGISYLGWAPTNFFLIDGANTLIFGTIFILRFFKQPLKKFNVPTIYPND